MFIMKCPYCKEFVRKGALRCKHCQSDLGGNGNKASQANDECLKYLQNGFARIKSEFEKIKVNMKLRTGFVFTKHLYSSDELLYALSKVESFVESMKDRLDEWEAAGYF